MYALVSYCLGNAVITGALIDTFEYFLQIYEDNREFKLVFLNCSPEHLKSITNVIEDRYILDNVEDFKKNIVCITIKDLMRMKFEKVLVVDFMTIKQTRGLLRSNEMIVITEGLTNIPEFFYSKDLNNVTYYSEMPFEYTDILYRMKCLFNRFKPLKDVKEGIYINSPRNKDFSFVKNLQLPDKPIIYKERRHLDNLFEHFDTYVYYHADKWFDPHPRLFHECYFYGKDILYFNEPGIKDGSYYRYNDLMDTGLKDRYLSKDDEVVKLFI